VDETIILDIALDSLVVVVVDHSTVVVVVVVVVVGNHIAVVVVVVVVAVGNQEQEEAGRCPVEAVVAVAVAVVLVVQPHKQERDLVLRALRWCCYPHALNRFHEIASLMPFLVKLYGIC